MRKDWAGLHRDEDVTGCHKKQQAAVLLMAAVTALSRRGAYQWEMSVPAARRIGSANVPSCSCTHHNGCSHSALWHSAAAPPGGAHWGLHVYLVPELTMSDPERAPYTIPSSHLNDCGLPPHTGSSTAAYVHLAQPFLQSELNSQGNGLADGYRGIGILVPQLRAFTQSYLGIGHEEVVTMTDWCTGQCLVDKVQSAERTCATLHDIKSRILPI
jgi:hypothetical protein